MAHVYISDLAHGGGGGGHGGGHGGGGGRGFRGDSGGGVWYGDGGPWYWGGMPFVVVDPFGPEYSEDDMVVEESPPPGMGQFGRWRSNADMGGAQATASRRALGLGDDASDDPSGPSERPGIVTAGAIAFGAIAGYIVGSMIYERIGRPA